MKELIDADAFEVAKSRIIGNEHNMYGIGTLQEKTMHGVLKNYYESNIDNQEVALLGYVADIFRDGNVIEIQTGNFGKLRDKLSVFLSSYKVKIVYPIPYEKYLTVINSESGEILSRRKSPKKGNVYEGFKELYRIKQYLDHENISIDFVLVNIEELRVESDKKRSRKPTMKYDRIPKDIVDIVRFEHINDYMLLLPETLPEEFTVKEFAKESRISSGLAGIVINILSYLNIVEMVGKRGKAYLYHARYD